MDASHWSTACCLMHLMQEYHLPSQDGIGYVSYIKLEAADSSFSNVLEQLKALSLYSSLASGSTQTAESTASNKVGIEIPHEFIKLE